MILVNITNEIGKPDEFWSFWNNRVKSFVARFFKWDFMDKVLEAKKFFTETIVTKESEENKIKTVGLVTSFFLNETMLMKIGINVI